MMKKNIYPFYNPASEIIAIPIIISRIFSGKKIKDLLLDIIKSTRKDALNSILSEKEKIEKEIEYNDLENFFATNFKALENSKVHTLEDKINYCLIKYAEESKKLLSPSNTVILEENFLKGANQTLSIYFKLNKDKEPEKSFRSIFANKECFDKFISVMQNNSYLCNDNKFDIPVIFFSGILIFLKNNGVIKNVKNIDIVKYLKNDFNYKISKSSLSSALPYPTKKEEEKIFNDLSKEFMIKY